MVKYETVNNTVRPKGYRYAYSYQLLAFSTTNNMLGIICAGSFALSINVSISVCQSNKLGDLTLNRSYVSEAIQRVAGVPPFERYAKRYPLGLDQEAIANESEYRREADREGERHEINSPVEESGDRVYRDGEERRREDESGDRIYRDGEEHRRDDYSETERNTRDRYERRDRSREDYEHESESKDNRSLSDFLNNWLSE